jgi:hypothetical protein
MSNGVDALTSRIRKAHICNRKVVAIHSAPRNSHMPAPAEPITDSQAAQADLESLGTELSALGCKTILTTGEGRSPRLDVLNPLAPTISKHIYAQADYFWWPTAEPIAPRTAIPAAANLVARALATIGSARTASRTPGRTPVA